MIEKQTLKKDENLVKLAGSSCTAQLENGGVVRLNGQVLAPAGFENPIIHPNKVGKAYRFVYGSGLFESGFYANSVGKVDLNDGKVILYKKSASQYPGEAVFVPKPNSTEEDDGIVITQVLDTDISKPNYLAILDAKTMEELAVIEFDRKSIQLPPSIHGLWQWPLMTDLQKPEQ